LPNGLKVTIEISDDDYRDMIQHIARAGTGRPLVAVIRVLDKDSLNSLRNEREFLHGEPRTRTVTKQQADYLANKTAAEGAYSADRYGADEWRKAAGFLAAHGFTAEEIETILKSKWMRWAADNLGNDGKASHIRAYIKAMHGDEFREAAKMIKEGK
jgi:hypothetical protein